MNASGIDHPNPTHDGCEFPYDVNPSIDCDEYAIDTPGASPPTEGGVGIDHDHEKLPDPTPTSHLPDPASDVAEKFPIDPDTPAEIPYTADPPAAAANTPPPSTPPRLGGTVAPD